MFTYSTRWNIIKSLIVVDAEQGLCDNLEEWDGEGDGREVQEGADMGVPMADACWCLTENHKIL